MRTLGSCRRELAGQLAGLENAAFEARQLLQGLLCVSQKELLDGTRSVTEEQWRMVNEAAQKRLAGYPLQYLLGEWEFYGLPFAVGEGVLIPRADTEILCEFALEELAKQQAVPRQKKDRVIDLCSGSGCLAVVLARRSAAQVFALEKSEQALGYLRENVCRNEAAVQVLQDDVLHPVTKETGFDLIVSNPPYLNDADMESLQREVRFEPEMALYAEQDGYLFYEGITAIWKNRLNIGGVLAYEVGIHQASHVAQILEKHGFSRITVRCDLNGIERVVAGKKEKEQMF